MYLYCTVLATTCACVAGAERVTALVVHTVRKPKAASERDIADIDFDRQAERRRMRAPNASRFKYIGASQKTVLQDAYLKEAVAEKAAMKKR